MSEKCMMKTLRFDVEVSIFNEMFQAAGYEDTNEGHIKLIEDLLNVKFKKFVFDGYEFESPPFLIDTIQKNFRCEESEKWEEVN